MPLNEQALFRIVLYWIVIPFLVLWLGLRRLRRTWPYLVYAALAGAYMYFLWTGKMTIGMLLLAIPLVAFGWYLRKRGGI